MNDRDREIERPAPNGRNQGAIDVLYYVEALRRNDQRQRETDLLNQRESMASLELRLQQRFDAQEKGQVVALSAAKEAVTAALIAAEKAVEKAEVAQQRQNSGANETKAMLSDMIARMWPSLEGQAALRQLEAKQEAVMAAEHREQAAVTAGILIRLTNLENALSGDRGRGSAFTDLRAVAVLAVSLAAIILTHFWH